MQAWTSHAPYSAIVGARLVRARLDDLYGYSFGIFARS